MLALKSKDTGLLRKSEKRSLRRFLAIYGLMALFILLMLASFYYQYEQKLMLSHERARLAKYADIQTKRLIELHNDFPFFDEYPRDVRFTSAIYDLEYEKIFSLLKSKQIYFDEEIYINAQHLHYIKLLSDYYLGAKFLVIEVEKDGAWREAIVKNILLYGMGMFVLLMLIGWYLAKLFVRPMQESLELLDRFIKDTTHELNTPLSAILANVEMMNTEVMVEENKKKLARINIAAKTVSNLYQDLTFLTLEQHKASQIEQIDLAELLQVRSEYFRVLAKSKSLSCDMQLKPITITADKRKMTRLVDNLISNAIKYSKRGGNITVTLKPGMLSIADEGVGMSELEVEQIFERYKRFNKSEGGFGVGLDIVKNIVDEYGMQIEVDSKVGEGTTVRVLW